LAKNYYIIRQEVPFLEPKIMKIFTPINGEHFNTFVSNLVGNISIYLYDGKNNSRKDMTNSYILKEFDMNEYKPELIKERKYGYRNSIYRYTNFEFYVYIGKKNPELKYFFMDGESQFLASGGASMENPFKSSLNNRKKNMNYGNSYEKYIASKYEENDYLVELNGINKNINDGGIDLIAKKDDSLILVQCKNWSMSNKYKINQKDLRAFIGDSFIYMTENELFNKKVSFHFIVSHDNILNEGAIKFLEEQNMVKFKVVAFEN
jgi:restriction system protein